MLTTKTSIPRAAPKAHEYVKRVLEYEFHNCNLPGLPGRVRRNRRRTESTAGVVFYKIAWACGGKNG
jgi:hypothetical protein